MEIHKRSDRTDKKRNRRTTQQRTGSQTQLLRKGREGKQKPLLKGKLGGPLETESLTHMASLPFSQASNPVVEFDERMIPLVDKSAVERGGLFGCTL